KQIIYQFGLGGKIPADDIERFPFLFCSEASFLHQLYPPGNRRYRRPEFVGERCDEFVFHPIRSFEFRGSLLDTDFEQSGLFAQGFFGVTALGHVASDFAKPRNFPVSSCNAVITTLAQNRVPSLRIRQPSSSTRPSMVAISSSRCGLRLALSSFP